MLAAPSRECTDRGVSEEQWPPVMHPPHGQSGVWMPETVFSQLMDGSSMKTADPVKKDRQTIKLKDLDDATDWLDYVRYFQRVASWNCWTQEEKGVRLSLALQGKAAHVLSTLSEAQIRNGDLLLEVLGRYFVSPEFGNVCRMELRTRVRRVGESLQDFAVQLRRLMKNAYPDVPQSVSELLLVENFIKGLHEKEMRRYVSLQKPSTLEDALRPAMEWETFEADSIPKVKKPPLAHAVLHDSSESEGAVCAALAVPDNSKSAPLESTTSAVGRKGKGKCRGGGQANALSAAAVSATPVAGRDLGALLSQVENLMKTQQELLAQQRAVPAEFASRQNPGRRENFDPKWGPKCYKCGEWGHISPHCPQRDWGPPPGGTRAGPRVGSGVMPQSGNL